MIQYVTSEISLLVWFYSALLLAQYCLAWHCTLGDVCTVLALLQSVLCPGEIPRTALTPVGWVQQQKRVREWTARWVGKIGQLKISSLPKSFLGWFKFKFLPGSNSTFCWVQIPPFEVWRQDTQLLEKQKVKHQKSYLNSLPLNDAEWRRQPSAAII